MSTVASHEETFYQDRKRLFTGLCHDFQERLTDIIRKRRKASLALAGGTTPGPLYEALSNAPLNWEKVSVTLTDERWITPEDPASNEYLVRDLLLRRRAAAATFVPLKTNHAKASGGAAIAEKRIAPIMPFDICLLGMGPDGHIASLIPDAEGYAAAADPNSTRKLAGIHAPRRRRRAGAHDTHHSRHPVFAPRRPALHGPGQAQCLRGSKGRWRLIADQGIAGAKKSTRPRRLGALIRTPIRLSDEIG